MVLKEGLKCDYTPTYCSKHGALGYAMFPTNSLGKCDKQPNLDSQFCQKKDDGLPKVSNFARKSEAELVITYKPFLTVLAKI